MAARQKRFSNVIGFDDAPFERNQRGAVTVVGTVYANLRFDGVLMGAIEKDGTDAAPVLTDMVQKSRFAQHVQLILLQGITMAGFNVVDPFALNRALRLPVLVVARRQPDFEAIRQALIRHIPEGAAKWATIQAIGPMEPAGSVYIQRIGLRKSEAADVLERFACHGHIPEPLRTAHLIAGAYATGHSRGNP